MPEQPGTRSYFSYFWDQRQPHVVKFDMERRTGTLLARDAEKVPLTYTGTNTFLWFDARIELRLEGSELNGTLYSLRVDATCRFDEARFAADSERAFHHWLRDMHVTADTRSIELASGERYEKLVAAALEFEAKQAAIKEDPAAIARAQQAVLDAFRSGKAYWSADHEGNTVIRMEGDLLVNRRTGETPYVETYSTREEMLAFLRNYFDWNARRDTLPHKPPEEEIWKFIARELR